MQNRQIQSMTHAGVFYDIADDGHGHITCSCPDYVHRRAALGTWCKHIVRYIERADILTRARAAKASKRAAMVTRATRARAARALQRVIVEEDVLIRGDCPWCHHNRCRHHY